MNNQIKLLEKRINPDIFCSKNQINYLGVFGSFAREENKSGSDIDFLVGFDEIKSLFEMAKIKLDLEKILGEEVDLALKDNIKPEISPYVLRDLITLYEKR